MRTIETIYGRLVMHHADPSDQKIVAGNNEIVNSIIPEWILTMKRIYLRNTLSATLLLGGLILATSALAQSQDGNVSGSHMMGGYGAGWMGGGYFGMLIPVLLVVVIAGLVAWIVAQKRK